MWARHTHRQRGAALQAVTRSRRHVVFVVAVCAVQHEVRTVTYRRVIGQVGGAVRLNAGLSVARSAVGDRRAASAHFYADRVVYGHVAAHGPAGKNPDPKTAHEIVGYDATDRNSGPRRKFFDGGNHVAPDDPSGCYPPTFQ